MRQRRLPACRRRQFHARRLCTSTLAAHRKAVSASEMITVKRILLAITQTRDGRIQLITSKDHCRGRGVIRSTPIHHGPQNALTTRSHELRNSFRDFCVFRGQPSPSPIHHGPQNAPNARSHELKIHSVSSVYSVGNLNNHRETAAYLRRRNLPYPQRAVRSV